MTNNGAAQPVGGKPKPGKIGFWAPALIVAFIAATLAGTYFVRLRILEKAMSDAMEIDDNATIWEVANSFPSPVNARDKGLCTPLHRAASRGDRALAELLIAKGADVNTKDNDGRTPLAWAAQYGEREVVEVLVAKGADINARDNSARTPLHEAVRFWNWEIVELLIARGADINAKDNDGKTALQWAIDWKKEAVAEVLRKAGAKE